MSDIDSFDIDSEVDGVNEILNSDSHPTNSNVWNNVKYWFYRNRLYWQSINNNYVGENGTSRDNGRGIPLYDLDNSGGRLDREHDGSLEFNHSVFNGKHSGLSSFIIRRKLLIRLISVLALFLTFTMLVSGSIKSTHPDQFTSASFLNNLINSHDFDPYKKYTNGSHPFYPLTMMISIDGFHPALISKKNTPFLHSLYTLEKEDYNITSTPYMIPSFPAQTFPNHWSLVTGDYPIDHGIVSNYFHDSVLDDIFEPQNEDPLFWYNASEPIWETIQRAYAKRDSSGKLIDLPYKVATHMWPGSNVDYSKLEKLINVKVPEERTPFYNVKYNQKETFDEKLKNILAYIDVEAISDRPQMILSYIPQIDAFGHLNGYPISVRNGIDEKNTKSGKAFVKLLKELDTFFETLFMEIKARNIEKFTNVLIVSDHGMSDIDVPENVIPYEELLSAESRKSLVSHAIYEGPILTLNVDKKATINSVYQELKRNLNQQLLSPFFNIYLSGQFPPEFNYNFDVESKENDILAKRRVPPIWVVPEPGFAIMDSSDIKKKKDTIIGSHGYNNTHIDMRSLFIGVGPYFNKGYVESFENVEIYKLLCDISGIKLKDRHISFRERKSINSAVESSSNKNEEEDDFETSLIKHNKDIFDANNFDLLLIEDDFSYIEDKFSKWNTYNYIWGGSKAWEEGYDDEDDETLENDTDSYIGGNITMASMPVPGIPSIISSLISSSAIITTDSSGTAHTTTLLQPNTIASTTSATTSASAIASSSASELVPSNSTLGDNVINWFGNLIDDAKDLIDGTKELIDNVVDEVEEMMNNEETSESI
ncbi:hypothetical protein TPHA_0O00860 [Tetrapisispora phaffii CBS 4417]|uniref:Uncharacterized protein n=1 Tax=Tetrapisispora phaffii (strain ATCC 24235 / CBS 4417 / NBRC 1672 / NRRL Y-8282 / UCD 70-5) TaxID=1071381 RepID=G8C1M7_TETPH|nr:hypothetical protein TPHA_0O00860 [Tetrapisispora phaffii CBS 4417]CCE66055.1 hypothetical protein TPHA_0O00860 [Tetrapisispora phaffii CBS 4417]